MNRCAFWHIIWAQGACCGRRGKTLSWRFLCHICRLIVDRQVPGLHLWTVYQESVSCALAEPHGGMPAAGASQHAAVEEVSTEVADEMFRLNVLGPIALTRAALPFLLSRRKGRLVVVSSMAAAVPAPGQAVYSGTKLALHGYFATLQSELNDRQATDSSLQVVMPGVLESVRSCRYWKI